MIKEEIEEEGVAKVGGEKKEGKTRNGKGSR